MSSFVQILPRLHGLLAVFFAAADDASLTLRARTKLVCTICILFRTILNIESWIYRAARKAEMLANPAWREAVIAELGGYWALRRWSARMVDGPKRRGPHRAAAQKPNKPRVISTAEFCLAPYPREAYARGMSPAETQAQAGPSRSPYDAPITVTADELYPAGRLERHAAARYARAQHDAAARQLYSRRRGPNGGSDPPDFRHP